MANSLLLSDLLVARPVSSKLGSVMTRGELRSTLSRAGLCRCR